MKICIVSPISLKLLEDLIGEPLPEGYRYPLGAYYTKALLDEGHEVVVVTNTFDVEETKNWKSGSLSIVATPRRKRPRSFCKDFYRSERLHMRQAIENCRPDIVHAHWTYEFAHAAISAPFPHVVTARDFPPVIFKNFRDIYRTFRLLYSFFVVPRCNNFVSISPYLSEYFRKFYRKKSCAVIPNGITIDAEFKQYDGGGASQEIVITVVSGWGNLKNVAPAIEAFKIVRAAFPTVSMHLFGYGLGENEAAHDFALRHGISAGLHYHGYTAHSEIKEFQLKHTDIFLHTSLEESFGMTILEAMVLGIPVVGGKNSGAVPWLIGDAGMTVDVSNVGAIADALLCLVKNREQRVDLGQKARRRAINEFSMKSVAKSYLRLFEKVLSKG